MHTGTITLLIVDVEPQEVVGIVTYLNMSRPRKIDCGPVLHRFQLDIAAYESDEGTKRIFSSHQYSCEVEVYTQIMFLVQDQPERRGASGLLGGNTKLHPLFGMSCGFVGLKLPFEACVDCENRLDEYLEAKDWTKVPMEGCCQHCLGWSLQRLGQPSYKSSFEHPANFQVNTPGASLFQGPGLLPSSLLIAAWNHCIDMLAHQACWLEADVKRYFKQLCINDATIAAFISSCRQLFISGKLVSTGKNTPRKRFQITSSTLSKTQRVMRFLFLPQCGHWGVLKIRLKELCTFQWGSKKPYSSLLYAGQLRIGMTASCSGFWLRVLVRSRTSRWHTAPAVRTRMRNSEASQQKGTKPWQ